MVVLPQGTRSHFPRTSLMAVATLYPAVNAPDPEGRLQTSPVALGRSCTISSFPRRPAPVTLVLDRCRRPPTAIALLPPVMIVSVPGAKLQGQWPLFPQRRVSQSRAEKSKWKLLFLGARSLSNTQSCLFNRLFGYLNWLLLPVFDGYLINRACF